MNRPKLCIPKKLKSEISIKIGGIRRRRKLEERWFKEICKKMNVHPDSWEGDILWDHMFNDTNINVFYSKK